MLIPLVGLVIALAAALGIYKWPLEEALELLGSVAMLFGVAARLCGEGRHPR